MVKCAVVIAGLVALCEALIGWLAAKQDNHACAVGERINPHLFVSEYEEMTDIAGAREDDFGGYRLYRYVFSGSGRAVGGGFRLGVLCVHGHGGGYKQFKAIAGALKEQMVDLEVFSVDFSEEFSAFSAKILERQGRFVSISISAVEQFMRRMYESEEKIPLALLGHSMGGVSIRKALVEKGMDKMNVIHVSTLSSPHLQPVLTNNYDFDNFYRELNQQWGDMFSSRFGNLTFISFTGGVLDVQIEPWTTDIRGIVPASNGMTVYSTSIPQYWSSLGHNEILYCPRFVALFARQFGDLFSSQGGSSVKAVKERIDSFKKTYSSRFKEMFHCAGKGLCPHVVAINELKFRSGFEKLNDFGWFSKRLSSSSKGESIYFLFDLSASYVKPNSHASVIVAPSEGQYVEYSIEILYLKTSGGLACNRTDIIRTFPGRRASKQDMVFFSIAHICVNPMFRFVAIRLSCLNFPKCHSCSLYFQIWNKSHEATDLKTDVEPPTLWKSSETSFQKFKYPLISKISFSSTQYPEKVSVESEGGSSSYSVLSVYYNDTEDEPGHFALNDDYTFHKHVHLSGSDDHTDELFVLSSADRDIKIAVSIDIQQVYIQALRRHHTFLFCAMFLLFVVIILKVSWTPNLRRTQSLYRSIAQMDVFSAFLLLYVIICLNLSLNKEVSWVLVVVVFVMSYALVLTLLSAVYVALRLVVFLISFCIRLFSGGELFMSLKTRLHNAAHRSLVLVHVAFMVTFAFIFVKAPFVALAVLSIVVLVLIVCVLVCIEVSENKQGAYDFLGEVMLSFLIYFCAINFQEIIWSLKSFFHTPTEVKLTLYDSLICLPIIVSTMLFLNKNGRAVQSEYRSAFVNIPFFVAVLLVGFLRVDMPDTVNRMTSILFTLHIPSQVLRISGSYNVRTQ